MENQNETRRLLGRLIQAEYRITSLEDSAKQTAKKITSGATIIGFVILALVVYHLYLQEQRRLNEELLQKR